MSKKAADKIAAGLEDAIAFAAGDKGRGRDASRIERGVAAAIANLHKQAETSGCFTEDNGASAQVDGSFKIEPMVRAILLAAEDRSPE